VGAVVLWVAVVKLWAPIGTGRLARAAQFAEWAGGQAASARFKSTLGWHCFKWAGPFTIFQLSNSFPNIQWFKL
jgi:hypothetical protein